MNKQVYSFILLFFSLAVSAQKGNFGIINYTVPPGYQFIQNDNVLTYYVEDKSTGAYCNFFVYNIFPGQSDIQRDFDNGWANQVQKPFKFISAPAMQPVATIKGWQFLLGNTRYSDDGVATLAMLITFSGESRMQSIGVLSNSDKYKADIESFISSIDVSREIGSAAAIQDKSVLPQGTKLGAPDVASENSGKNVPYEVWECHCMNISSSDLELKTVVLSPDGRCLYYMPEKGLNGVTPSTSSWGIVTDKGNVLELRNKQYGNMELYKTSPGSMSRYPNSKTTIYKKVRKVDGLRLEGAYSPELSYYNGKTNIISGQIDPNKQPIIFFKKDGTYINEGLEFSNLTFGDNYARGKGAYEIVNYSLILTTQSGRKLQVAFTPLLDANPASDDNRGLMINNNLFYRLNKSFVPHN